MYCCIPTPTTDSNTRTGMIWVALNMPSAAEECREPSGKCQGIVREFHVVWRVVTLYKLNYLFFNSVPITGIGMLAVPRTAHFCRTMLCKCGLSRHAVSVCLGVSVCLSVTFVHSVVTNKRIFRIFLPSGSHTILVFPHRTGMAIFQLKPP